MNTKDKLEAIGKLLANNSTYSVPHNLIEKIKYLSFIDSVKDEEEQFNLLRYLSMSITSKSVEEKVNTVTISKAIDNLLNSSLFNWEDTDSGLTKYAAFILEEAFKEISPIEWAKILANTNKGTN